jgi:catechol 2,3-dioxygenase-like lactoylglutathione lyase family enzyme
VDGRHERPSELHGNQRRFAMPMIRHIALYTDDMERQARFYQDAFGLKEMRRSKGAISLTDGYLGVTLLKSPPDAPKKGLDHFGFQVESLDETEQRLRRVAPDIHIEKPEHGNMSAEYKVTDPDGNVFDISEKGWIR